MAHFVEHPAARGLWINADHIRFISVRGGIETVDVGAGMPKGVDTTETVLKFADGSEVKLPGNQSAPFLRPTPAQAE